MEELASSFRLLLGRKEYDKLDGIWLDLVDSGIDPDELLELAELANRYAPPDKAEDFLWLLADALKDKKDWDNQFLALKRLIPLTANEGKLALELAANLRQMRSDAQELEKLLQKSGLSYGRPLKQALAEMERYLDLLPGSWLFGPEWGACRVEKLDLLLGRVTIRCSELTEYTLNLDSVHRRLRPAARNGYFRRLAENRPGLTQLASDNPGEVVALYLRDTGRPEPVKELKTALSELVSDQAWDGFWNRARKTLDRHPHVLVRTRPVRAYQWSEKRIQRTAETRSQVSDTRSQKAGIQDSMDLNAMSDQEVLKAYKTLSTFTQRRQMVETLLHARAGLLSQLFVLGKDNKLRSWLVQAVSSPEATQELLNAVLTDYRDHPDALLWLAGRVRADRHGGMAPGAVSRLVDLLESQAFKRRWTALKNSLVADGYRILKLALDRLEEQPARALYARLLKLTCLEAYQRDEIQTLFAARFPDLGKKANADFILSTAAGIEKARQELTRLTNEEIPRSAEEVGRARAHGDLSENYEYKAAKEKQARLMKQAGKLRTDLTMAKPIAADEIDCSTVSVGCKVMLEDQTGSLAEYAVLGPWDSDPDHGVISYMAPLAQKLLGRKPGETVELDGRMLTIKEIAAAPLT